jgi:hypothetical protein
MCPEQDIPLPINETEQKVYRTSIESQLNVEFPENQEFFGIIGKDIGKFPENQFTHIKEPQVYKFAEGTIEKRAEQLWQEMVADADVHGKLLSSDPNNPNISLVSSSVSEGQYILKTKNITYKEYKAATTPEMEELIKEGEVEPHLMLAQCQVIRGYKDGKPVVVLSWRDPLNNDYKGGEMHLIGGHYRQSEGTIFNTWINELRDETGIPVEQIAKDKYNRQHIYMTGMGWNRELQKPELLAISEIDPQFDLSESMGKGRGVKTFALPDDPKAIADAVIRAFPLVVPSGVAGLYAHMLVNHGEIGRFEAHRMTKALNDETKRLRQIKKESGNDTFHQEIRKQIIDKASFIRRKAGLSPIDEMSEDEQEKLIEQHIPSYEALLKSYP